MQPFNRSRATWTRSVAATLGLGIVLALTGCDSDSDNAEAALRIIHGSPDAPAVNAKLDGAIAVSDLDYGESTGYVDVDADTYDVAVEGIIPGGNLDVITVDDFELAADSRTTVVAVNRVATIEALVVADSATSPAAGEVALQVLHASPSANDATGPAGVDIYLTAPGVDINTVDPAFNFGYKGNQDVGAVAAGSVQIVATVGATKTVVYDVEVDLSPFAGQHLLVMALDTVNPTASDASVIKLLVATDSAAVTLFDKDTQAGARVVHASPDAADPMAANGPVEVWASTGMVDAQLIDTFNYLDIVPPGGSTHTAVAPGDYVFNVSPDVDDINASVFNSDTLTLAAGGEYTVIASGQILNANPDLDFDLLVSVDDSRSVATQASVKVVHGAPAAGNVHVYVTPAGDFSVMDVELGNAGDPLLADFAFGSITDYVAVAPGDYDIRVVPVASGMVAINDEGRNLTAGAVVTVVAHGPDEVDNMPSDFGLLLLTN